MNLNRYESLFNYRFILSLSLLLIISIFLFANPRDQLGDVNDDGDINVLDIVRIVNIIMENDPDPTEDELWASDVNADGTTNVQDIVIIIQVIMETDDCPDLYSPCSDNLSLCCPDTTSHDFTWFADTIGMYGSQLMDVAVIDENSIWIVGALTIDDSTLQFPGQTNYNAARWDGDDWIMEEIQTEFNGNLSTTILYSITYVSENDIWVSNGTPIHWDGSEWNLYHLWDMGVLEDSDGILTDIFLIGSDNIFFIGMYGTIVHYNGESFESMESGTDVDLKDICSTQDGEHVFAVGYEDSGESIALRLIDNEWSEIYSGDSYFVEPTSIYGRVSAVEALGDTAYFTTTAGLLKYVIPTEEFILTAEDQYLFEEYQFVDISLNEANDIMLFTRPFSFLHYNGESWFHADENSEVYSSWAKGGDYANNTAAAVGYCCGGVAYVVRGYRE